MAEGGIPTREGGMVTKGGGIAQAATTPIQRVDSFEDGAAGDSYTVTNGSFTAVNDPTAAVDGDYYARSTGGIMYSLPGDGLANYYSSGRARAYTLCENAATERAWVLFRVVDNFNYWAARVDYDNGAFGLVRRTESGGIQTIREDTGVAPAADTLHAVGMNCASDDTITIQLIEAATGTSLSAIERTDSTHSGAEGVGWIVDGSGSNGVRFDHYHLR